MLVQGLQPVQPGARPNDQPLQLHLNQRVTAEILNVNGEQIEMVIQGVRVIGRLQTNDQPTMLDERRTAQFIIRGAIDGVLQLQLVKPIENVLVTQPSSALTILAQNLLILNNLEVTEQNMALGKALLNHGLPMTPQLMEELTNVLNGLNNWGQGEADVAAALKAGGMPLTQNTLSLVMQTMPTLAEGVSRLQNQLAELATGQAGGDIARLAEQALKLLQSSTIDWSKPLPRLLEDLKQAISIWGKSLESELAKQAQNGNIKGNEGWLALAQLRRALDNNGYRNTVRSIDQFMEGVRQMQFLNTASPIENGNPPWLLVNLPVAAHLPGQPTKQETFFPASLRIAYRTEGKTKRIDSENTRLVLTVDLMEGDYLTADLSFIGKRVGAWLTVSSDELKEKTVDSLPELESRLEQLGLRLQVAQCEVASVGPVLTSEEIPALPGSQGIDIEV
jgi:hypothetical protein